ncbi:MAG TPA: Zn-ribbon domain-containing OB-fold protein [Deltaproteobacteria bacterium]|nr:Zn-ribbon domain-containing OB-fold protein [Deltaproteobacteria bacterium]
MENQFNNLYSVILDTYPMEGKQLTKIWKFFEYLKEGRLTTTKCIKCGKVSYPPRILCPECLSEELEWIDLPTKGTVEYFTELKAGVPVGFEKPLIHAYIKLSDSFDILSKIVGIKSIDDIHRGDKVKLKVFDVPPIPAEIGRDKINIDRVYFAFELDN